jgi:hypothetical protein
MSKSFKDTTGIKASRSEWTADEVKSRLSNGAVHTSRRGRSMVAWEGAVSMCGFGHARRFDSDNGLPHSYCAGGTRRCWPGVP